jgi:hypothetical protein
VTWEVELAVWRCEALSSHPSPSSPKKAIQHYHHLRKSPHVPSQSISPGSIVSSWFLHHFPFFSHFHYHYGISLLHDLNKIKGQHQWLMPVILATQEAEIRRIVVWSQPRQIVCETLYWKNPSQKRAGGVAQGVSPEFKPQCHKKKKKEFKAIK